MRKVDWDILDGYGWMWFAEAGDVALYICRVTEGLWTWEVLPSDSLDDTSAMVLATGTAGSRTDAMKSAEASLPALTCIVCDTPFPSRGSHNVVCNPCRADTPAFEPSGRSV